MNLAKLMGLPEVFSEHGGSVDYMIVVVHWLMIVLFVGWTSFFLFCLWRFAERRNPRASYTGVRSHLSTHLEIGIVIVEAVLLLGFAFPLWFERTDRFQTIMKQNPVRVRAIGYQFGWNYHYPGTDGKFGRIDRSLISKAGDPCIDPDDPNGFDDFLASVLRLPVGRPAILQVTSTDVIHNYSIIPMRIQQDALPGKDIPMWFRPTRKLETNVVCGQLCGEGHGNMVGLMEVIDEGAYAKWEATQSSAALERNTARDSAVAWHADAVGGSR